MWAGLQMDEVFQVFDEHKVLKSTCERVVESQFYVCW